MKNYKKKIIFELNLPKCVETIFVPLETIDLGNNHSLHKCVACVACTNTFSHDTFTYNTCSSFGSGLSALSNFFSLWLKFSSLCPFFMVYLVFCEILNPIGQMFYAIWTNLHCYKWTNIEQIPFLAIWSHWSRSTWNGKKSNSANLELLKAKMVFNWALILG